MRILACAALAAFVVTSCASVSGAKPSPCPAGAPAAGTPCEANPSAAVCEYGGDAFGRCRTSSACSAESVDGPFTWHTTTDASCPTPNAGACPAAFAALADGAACPAAPLSCEYDEGVCGCVCNGAATEWQCRRRDSVGPGCPADRPPLGSTCDVDGTVCAYADTCRGVLTLGTNQKCENGLWAVVVQNVDCAAPSCTMGH